MPTVRVDEKACPFTAGYWAYFDRHRSEFAGNHRMAQAVPGLDRLKDLELLVLQERDRGYFRRSWTEIQPLVRVAAR